MFSSSFEDDDGFPYDPSSKLIDLFNKELNLFFTESYVRLPKIYEITDHFLPNSKIINKKNT